MDGATHTEPESAPLVTAPIVRWSNSAQQLRQLLGSSTSLKQLDTLTKLCSTIESIPPVATFPVHMQHKQQQAIEQLLLLVPQLLARLLGQRTKLWLQDEQYCSSIRSVLQCFHHVCTEAGIDHSVEDSPGPLIGTLAQQWLGLTLLDPLAAALQEMAQLLSQHQPQQQQQPSEPTSAPSSPPSHALMALAYALVYVWLDIDTVVVASGVATTKAVATAQLCTAAEAAAAVVLAAARVMPLDTPPVCHSMLLDVGLRLLLHPGQAWGDPNKRVPTDPAFLRYVQNPDVLGIVLLLLTLQVAVIADRAGLELSLDIPAQNASAAATAMPAAVPEQQVQELQQQVVSLWQQLGIRPELLPSFLTAMQPKYELDYVGYIIGFAEHIGLTGPAQAFALATGLLLRMLICSPALRSLGTASNALCNPIKQQEALPKVSAAGKQQQLLLGSVALQLPGVLLSTAALSDPNNNVLQYASITTSELLLCCWQELGTRHAAALLSGDASSSRAGSCSSSSSSSSTHNSSSRDVSTSSKGGSKGTGSSGSNSSGSNSSSSSALQWAHGEVDSAVENVLQCWCRLMQQQLQLAVKPTALPDLAPSGTDTAAVNQGPSFDMMRLNTITCLLPVLAEVSMASTNLHVHDPWCSQGCEVLQLLEQYVRTVLAHLHCDRQLLERQEIAAGASADSPEHRQWQQQQQQTGAGAGQAGTLQIRASLHADIQLCPCCINGPKVDVSRHEQFLGVLSQLLFGTKHIATLTPAAKLTTRPCDINAVYTSGPLVDVSCVPGSALQQQLLSLLITVHKRLQGCFTHEKFALFTDLDQPLHHLIGQLAGTQDAQLIDAAGNTQAAHMFRTQAVAASQLCVLLGRSLLRSGSRLQHLLQQAAAAAAEAAGGSDRRSSRASSGRQRRGGSSAGQAEAEVVHCILQISRCLGPTHNSLVALGYVGDEYEFLMGKAQFLRRASALDQLLQLHDEAWGDADGLAQQQQHDVQQPAQQQQQQQPTQQQQQAIAMQQEHQDGAVPAHKVLQLPPVLPHLGGDLQCGVDAVMSAVVSVQLVAAAAYTAAQRAAGVTATKGLTLNPVPEFEQLSRVLRRPSPSEKEQLASARTASECMAVLLACPDVQQLPLLLKQLGDFMCGAVPVSSCCNNPGCTNLSGVSELQLVQGRAAKCKACGTARYCSKACQAAHWKMHKPVCPTFAAQLAAATSVQGLVQEALDAHADARSCITAAADAAEQLYSAAAAAYHAQTGTSQVETEQQQQQQQEVPDALFPMWEAAEAVYQAEDQLIKAAWVDQPEGLTPSAQELMGAAVAAIDINSHLCTAFELATTCELPSMCDEWQQGVEKAVGEASEWEVAAAQALALAYHALTSSKA